MKNNYLLAFQGTEELAESGVLDAEIQEVAEEAAKAEVAEATIEIQEVAEEVADLAEKLEELEEVQEELVETVEGMEAFLASGTFNGPAFANMYQRAAKLSAKLGGDTGDRMGAESFADASTAAVNARNGMESFSDTAKKWGTDAIAFIKSLFNRLISFVLGLFSKTKGLDKRINFLSERLKSAEIKADAKVKLGGWNTLLDIAANKSPAKLTLGNAKQIYTSVLGSSFGEEVETAAKNGDANPLVSKFNTGYSALRNSFSTGKDVTGSDSDSVGRLVQYGAWRMIVSFHKGEVAKVADMVTALKALKYTFTKDSEVAKKLTGDSIAALSKAELTSILASAKETVTDVEKAKLEDKFSAARRDKIVGLLNVATKDVEDKKDAKAAVSFIKQYCATSGSFLTVFAKAQLKVAEAKIDCVAAHV